MVAASWIPCAGNSQAPVYIYFLKLGGEVYLCCLNQYLPTLIEQSGFFI